LPLRSEAQNGVKEEASPQTGWYRPPYVQNGKYTGEEWAGPTWPKPADEPSLPYADFLKALRAGEVVVVDFVGRNGDKVFVTRKGGERIRVGAGLPNETTPPPPSQACADCTLSCKREDMSCSCLSACGGKQDWYSPLYTAKVVRAAGVPFRYSEGGGDDFFSLPNLARKWVMFDGPMSAGLI